MIGTVSKITFGLLTVFLCGCSTSPAGENNTTPPTDTDSVAVTQLRSGLEEYSPVLQTIFKTNTGVLRGIGFGDRLPKVAQAEAATDTVESQPGQRMYLLKLNRFEDADLIYFHDAQGRVTGFGIDPYLNSPEAADSLMQELGTYFGKKYGPPMQRQAKIMTWKNDTIRITVEDVSIREAPGLQVRITRK